VLLGMNAKAPALKEDEAGALPSRPSWVPWALLATGAVLTAVSISLLGASVTPPAILSLAIAPAQMVAGGRHAAECLAILTSLEPDQ